MSAEDILESQQMGELPGTQFPGDDPTLFKSGEQIPPDLIYRNYRGDQQGTNPLDRQNDIINGRNYPDLFRAIRRQGYFVTQPFLAGTTVINPRPYESRTYLFIQNINTVGDIFVGFGNEPTGTYGLTLTPGAAYEPFTIPVNEIYILGSVANVAGFIIYAREAG